MILSSNQFTLIGHGNLVSKISYLTIRLNPTVEKLLVESERSQLAASAAKINDLTFVLEPTVPTSELLDQQMLSDLVVST